MAKFIQIAGSMKAQTAVVILSDDGSITSTQTIDATSPTWNVAPLLPNFDSKTTFLSLNMQTVATVTLKPEISYLTSLTNPKATWKSFIPALGELKVRCLVGDLINGVIAIAGPDDTSVYRSSTDPTPAWKPLTSPIPFIDTAKIAHIAGDNVSGVMIVSDELVSSLARLTGACESWTLLASKAPIKIDLITGDCVNGFIVCGEGQMYKLDVTKDAVWISLPSLNFNIVAISGNPKDGVVALIGDGNVVVYCKDVTKGPWCVALVPDVVAVTKSE